MIVRDEDEIDLDTICNMIERAEREGLASEVVYSFANAVRSGVKDFKVAAAEALYEWDV